MTRLRPALVLTSVKNFSSTLAESVGVQRGLPGYSYQGAMSIDPSFQINFDEVTCASYPVVNIAASWYNRRFKHDYQCVLDQKGQGLKKECVYSLYEGATEPVPCQEKIRVSVSYDYTDNIVEDANQITIQASAHADITIYAIDSGDFMPPKHGCKAKRWNVDITKSLPPVDISETFLCKTKATA